MRPVPSRPLDDDARKCIATSLDESLFVEAGAGTGKTTALVERLSGLLASGVQVNRIAAITFTRAAASELRSRVRERLEREAVEGLDGNTRASLVRGALEHLDEAAIQTIDSFALGILRDRPIEAGLPPVIEPLDEIEAGLRFEEAWQEWLQSALDDPDFAEAVGLAASLGLQSPLSGLREVAGEFHSRYDLLPPGAFDHAPRVERLAAASLTAEASALQNLIRWCEDPSDRLCRHISESVLPLIERLQEAGPASDESLAILAAVGKNGIKGPPGNKKNWRGEAGEQALADARAVLDEAQKRVDDELAAMRHAALAPLLNAVVRFVHEYAEKRCRAGTLEFRDLLVLACRLLREDQDALLHFRSRFTSVLIDEFQDTDPLQTELAALLAFRLSQNRPDPGALFVVGDPKQSIYRFRGADIQEFKRVQVNPGWTLVRLQHNFRSHPAILRWVNHIFSRWMRETAGAGQAEYVDLIGGVEIADEKDGGDTAHSQYDGQPPHRVLLLGGEIDVDGVEEVRRAEADAIARLALEVGAQRWRVRKEDGRLRPSCFEDLCILLPSRTGLDVLERALEEHGVPYTLEGQSLVFSAQDVRDLLNCLTAVDDPTDQVAVVAALRSPAFGCSDVDLLRWSESKGLFDFDRDAPVEARAAAPTVAEAFDYIRHANALSRTLSTPELIERFIRERRLRELAVASLRKDDQLRRIQLIVELSRQLRETGRDSLRDFIRWAWDRQQARHRMVESALALQGKGAVRVMTIHAAKGLEFPIVVMAGLTTWRHKRGKVIFGSPGGTLPGVAVRIGPDGRRFETPGFEELSAQDMEADWAEQVRLLYVAATRARDFLVVSVSRELRGKAGASTSEDRNRASLLAALCADAPTLWAAYGPAAITAASRQGPSHPPREFNPEEWEGKRRAVIAAASKTGSVTATSLVRTAASAGQARDARRGQPAPKTESHHRGEEPWRSGRAASEFGRAVHAVLQEADLRLAGQPLAAIRAALAQLATRHAHAHGLVERAPDVASLSAAVLKTPVLGRAAEAAARGRCWREVTVAAPLLPLRPTDRPPIGLAEEGRRGGTHLAVLEGIIDLVFEGPSGDLVIVDYKTDRLKGGEPLSQAAEPYIHQMGAYALAVEEATGRRVSEAVIVFASRAAAGQDSEYHLTDLDAAKSEAAWLAAETVTADG